MGGGLMQLVAYGAQDVYLTGNPQITFFKVVYRRHTNFAIEAIEQTFSGSPSFDRKVQCQIVRNGDLVTKMYLKTRLPGISASTLVSGASASDKVSWCPKVGFALVESVELEIGGSRIDKHYGDWMNVWYELTRQPGQDRGFDKMVGNDDVTVTPASSVEARRLYVPLQFFHCRNDGLALPLIALQYHDVRVNFELAKAADLLCHSGSLNTSAASALVLEDTSLLVNYIYLDSEERKRFAQASHEYLIEQLQFTGSETVNSDKPRIRLNFNHPCKELVWNVQLAKWMGSQFLAWLPSDPVAMRDLATRRFVTMCADVGVSANGGSNNGIRVQGNTNSAVLSRSSVQSNSALLAKFNAIGAQVIGGIVAGVNPTVENATFNDITYESPLSWADVSKPVDVLFAGVVVNTGAQYALPMTVNDPFNYSTQLNKEGLMLDNALLQLNGHDRFDPQEGSYFNYVQPWEAHSATPSDGVNVYTFALNPEDHQPSGTCNFSRIDNATLNLNFLGEGNATLFNSTTTGTLNVYAVNYNVLRVMSGMGGLAYSN
jgi:hypothetical protein